MPEITAFEVAAVIVLLLPGLVYAVVRRRMKGFLPDDLAFDSRIAQALVVSALLDAVYLAFGWEWIKSILSVIKGVPVVHNPVGLGWAVFLGCGLIPAGLAIVLNLPYRIRRRREGDAGWARRPWRFERTIRSSDVPTAWDEAAARPNNRMVRVLFPDGRWVGGFYGGGSFVSTFPQPRDIYISNQYEMEQATGKFGPPIEESAGVWLRISDEHVVEFLKPVWTDEEIEEIEEMDSKK